MPRAPTDAEGLDQHGEAEPLHDRLLRWGLDHLPGTTARAMRIAIGVER